MFIASLLEKTHVYVCTTYIPDPVDFLVQLCQALATQPFYHQHLPLHIPQFKSYLPVPILVGHIHHAFHFAISYRPGLKNVKVDD